MRMRTSVQCRSRQIKKLVGAGRFELPTPTTPLWCATRLRYAPTCKKITAKILASNVVICATAQSPIDTALLRRMIRATVRT